MEILTTARHFDLDEKTKVYLEKKLVKLERFFDRIMSAHVILTVEGYRHTAEILVKAPREELTCKAESENLFAAIDQAADRLERQIKKAKDKRRSKRRSREDSFENLASAVEDVEERGKDARVIVSDEHAPTLLSIDDAIEQLELTKKEFLVFIDTESQELKVVYRRNDGNYGLIETGR
jgi:putative sigma-54 modulation protein